MKQEYIFGGVVVVLVAIIITGGVWYQSGPSKYDGFAKCLADRGAKFYGAFWCPHCAEQKALFGTAKKYLPYNECSTGNGQGQLPLCEEKNINTYPTWDFLNATRTTGVLSLTTLASTTGCLLPE